jgi:cytohesin
MKHIPTTTIAAVVLVTIAAVVLVGCGKSDDIWTAAEEGNVEDVKGYLANGVDVDERDELYAGTPLHFAAYSGNEVVELLIANGADVNAKNQADATPLDKAIEKNRDETVSLLRKHGGKTKKELEAAGKSIKPIAEAAKPKPPTAKASDTSIHVAAEAAKPKPPTAKAPDISIHEAAGEGIIEAVKQHLAAGTDVNAKSDGEFTPLHWAIPRGHKEIVELLIAKGADVNAKDKYGMTPLLRAAFDGHKEIAELLIANGAEVNVKSNDGRTPLDVAIQYNKPETADLIRKHGGKTKKELEAAGKSIKPIAEAAKPKPPTAKASDTSIHVATEAAKPKPPTAKESDTSIHVATEAGNIESVKQAIADGADVNEKNADGVAPLSNAAYFGHKEVVELLITNGADVNAKFDGRTPLDVVTRPDNTNKNKAELADLLRKHGGKTGEELKAEGK